MPIVNDTARGFEGSFFHPDAPDPLGPDGHEQVRLESRRGSWQALLTCLAEEEAVAPREGHTMRWIIGGRAYSRFAMSHQVDAPPFFGDPFA